MSDSHIAESGQFDLILNEQVEGEQVLENPSCLFSYHWDFDTNMGLAHLISINGSPVNIALHPLGIEGALDFMSDMEPTKYSVNASPGESIALVDIIINRVILDMDPNSTDRSAAIMFNPDGSSIQASSGFSSESTKKSLKSI